MTKPKDALKENFTVHQKSLKILRKFSLWVSLPLSLRSTSELSGTALMHLNFLGGGWELIQGWALINISYLQSGRSFKVGHLIE